MSVSAIIEAQRWSQMTNRWQITAILITLPPKCISALKKYVFFLVFFLLRPTKWSFSSLKLAQIESIIPELSFDTKIVWLGLLFVLKFCQETSKKQP